ncbi:SLC13 family permease [Youngiibacter multivorans]|jgi:di/tricarboxylate transporter|uniref:Di/tricarboxylate transporter n=1 Tax=Youngiibacter multivorans TaxID=937251 RepID=A0ABS4G7E9_9CLOT|nr:SLC13 family permease [Youngiibacter multivorans]MBP1920454.1 di/tricarboxylate transporter [Youngiibacter multivorans]
MSLYLCLFAILAAIVIGWKFNFNTGILAMGFAFIIGNLVMGLKVSEIISFWPTNIVFFLIAISLFFTYATSNGTMTLVGEKLLYAMNGNAKLIPWVIALVSAVVAFLGAGASTPAIVGPLAFALGIPAGIHPIMIAVTVGCATLIGADNPINGFGGVISKNLIEKAGYGDASFAIANYVWINSAFKQIFIIAIFYIVFKCYKAKRVEIQKPKDFDDIQKKTLWLILAAFAFMVLPAVINTWVPGIKLVKALATFSQPQVIMVIAAILARALKLGDEKDIIRKLPMNTILMIAGVALLLGIAKEAGLVDQIASILTNNIPKFWVPAMLVLFAAFLSFFSSGTSVVCPLMYPLVPVLATSLSLNPVMLFSCIFIGAMASSLSPFSTGGAMVISGCPDPKIKEQLTTWMIPVSAVVVPAVCVVLATVGLFGLFSV